MKTIKILLVSLLILWWIGLNYSTNAFTQEDLNKASQALVQIKNWDVYIKVIDAFIEKHQDNKKILEKLQSRINKLDEKLWEKHDVKSQKLKILLNYLNIKVEIALQELLKEEIEKIFDEETTPEEDSAEEDNTEEETAETISYPGFSDTYNENDKTILAGEESYIYKQSVSSLYEASDVETVAFYITSSDSVSLKNTIESATLLLEWSIIDTVWSSQVENISGTQTRIVFENLQDFIITQNIRQMRLKIKTNPIWYQKIWSTVKDAQVTKVWFEDIKGLSSGSDINNFTSLEPGELFSIAPGILNIDVTRGLSSNIPEINIVWLFDGNSIDANNSAPIIELKTLSFSTLWSSSDDDVIYTIYNNDSSGDRVQWVVSWNTVEFDMSPLLDKNKTISNSLRWEDYKIVISGTNTNTVLTLDLLKDGIVYDVRGIDGAEDIHTNFPSDISLGSKSY